MPHSSHVLEITTKIHDIVYKFHRELAFDLNHPVALSSMYLGIILAYLFDVPAHHFHQIHKHIIFKIQMEQQITTLVKVSQKQKKRLKSKLITIENHQV